MLGYNRTITITNINVLLNIGPGAGEGRKNRGKKKNSLPNNFDDNCSPEFVPFIVFFLGLIAKIHIERNFKSCWGRRGEEGRRKKEEKIKRKISIACRELLLSIVRVKLEILLTCHDHASSLKYYKPIQTSV